MHASNDVFITRFAYSLGDQSFTVEESAAAGRIASKPELMRRAGFRAHRVCRPGTSAYSLACAALDPMREHLAAVDVIIHSSALPVNSSMNCSAWFADAPAPSTQREREPARLAHFPGSQLQADYAMDNAQVFGLTQQACTGLLGSLRMARALLLSEAATQTVLCVTADRFPEGAMYEQSYNLVSDGGAALLVSREQGPIRLLATSQITNGALAEANEEQAAGSYFSYAHRIITQTLEQAGMTIKDISWIVPQNMNALAWEILAKFLGVPMSRVCISSLPQVAHVISADNVVNLQALLDSGSARSGDRLLLLMAGWGVNYQCAILEVS
jgi:3-oxoacyl-[acyl-carrier-protein] synthase-3